MHSYQLYVLQKGKKGCCHCKGYKRTSKIWLQPKLLPAKLAQREGRIQLTSTARIDTHLYIEGSKIVLLLYLYNLPARSLLSQNSELWQNEPHRHARHLHSAVFASKNLPSISAGTLHVPSGLIKGRLHGRTQHVISCIQGAHCHVQQCVLLLLSSLLVECSHGIDNLFQTHSKAVCGLQFLHGKRAWPLPSLACLIWSHS